MDPVLPYFSARKPAKCPACGSVRIARILYGMPTSDVVAALDRGEIVLGGCCVSDCDPDWQCLDCETPVYAARLKARFSDGSCAF